MVFGRSFARTVYYRFTHLRRDRISLDNLCFFGGRLFFGAVSRQQNTFPAVEKQQATFVILPDHGYFQMPDMTDKIE